MKARKKQGKKDKERQRKGRRRGKEKKDAHLLAWKSNVLKLHGRQKLYTAVGREADCAGSPEHALCWLPLSGAGNTQSKSCPRQPSPGQGADLPPRARINFSFQVAV